MTKQGFQLTVSALAACICFSWASETHAQRRIVVPGTGTKIEKVGDDFEDEEWSYNFKMPKSSENIDKQRRGPFGRAANNRWYEGAKRGDPDVAKRVKTPEGGLAGSKGALLLKSLNTGVPGRKSFKLQQDDFICNIHEKGSAKPPFQRNPVVSFESFCPASMNGKTERVHISRFVSHWKLPLASHGRDSWR